MRIWRWLKSFVSKKQSNHECNEDCMSDMEREFHAAIQRPVRPEIVEALRRADEEMEKDKNRIFGSDASGGIRDCLKLHEFDIPSDIIARLIHLANCEFCRVMANSFGYSYEDIIEQLQINGYEKYRQRKEENKPNTNPET